MPNTQNRIVELSLNYNDLGQIIDGLSVRRDSWRNTQKYLEGHEVDCLIEDCSDPEEARFLTDNYDRIIEAIKTKL